MIRARPTRERPFIDNPFPTEAACLAHLERVRWDGRPTCPYCSSDRVSRATYDGRYHCNACNTSFSVTVNTLFHRTRLDLRRWFVAIALILNAGDDVTAAQLARGAAVSWRTADHLGRRIRRAMRRAPDRELLQRIVDMGGSDG